jgi:hypothetical protein
MALGDGIDIQSLMSALDDEDNASLMKMDTRAVKAAKNDMLQKLNLPREQLKKLHKQLTDYRYVDEMNELKYGAYIRWIPLRDPNKIKLTNGGIICDILVKDNGIHVVCRNNMHRMFQIRLVECMVFQKLSDQERVLLSVMDYLSTA